MTLTQNGGTVSGAGKAPLFNVIAGQSVPTAITVSGSVAGSGFSMTFAAQGYQPINFSGSLTAQGQQLAGTLNGSGFANQPISFNRQ